MIILQLYLRLNKNNLWKRNSKYVSTRSLSRVAKVSKHSNLKILSPKQMLQRLTIALLQIKASTTSENLLNKIRQIIYSLHRAKEIAKKAYNNIRIQ